MEIELLLHGAEANEKSLLSLQDWLKKSEIPGLQIRKNTKTPVAGYMGADIETILKIVLSSAVVTQFARTLHLWVQNKKMKIKVSLTIGDEKLELDAENVPEQSELMTSITKLVESVGAKR